MKNSFKIEGLGGKQNLTGKFRINGAKNAATKMMAASILFKDNVTLTNIPIIEDVLKMAELLKHLGAQVTQDKNTFNINTNDCNQTALQSNIAQQMRSSVVLIGPMLARFGKVRLPHPGGCVIGARPIDLFVDAFEKMGAIVTTTDREYLFEGKLHGAEIFLDISSVGVTETVMLAAVLARGTTTIQNAATEPEIVNVGEFLNQSGAKINGLGTSTITITGVDELKAREEYVAIPDRIEAGSMVILGALSGDNLKITNCEPKHLQSLLSLLKKAGVDLEVGRDYINVKKGGEYKSVNVKTHEYPGFATDLQAPMVVFLTQTSGESTVFETMFEGRLNYVDDLIRMGASITMYDPHRIMVRDQNQLSGKTLDGPDLRAGLAFILAGIVANGESIINNIHYVDRGHERIEERLREIGVIIERV